jgi:L-fuculose-phosphate aldolase
VNSEFKIKQDICEIGRRMYEKNFVAANDGNITVKVNDNEFWATPTGVSKGFMTPDMLIKVNMEGKVLEGTWKPSSELKMHLRVYKERPDVGAVVHAHPPTATGFAVAGIPLNKYIMPEAVIFLGSVPIAEYGTPSTDEVPNAISKYLQTHDAILLQNHGALTVGQDLFSAYFKMETLEFYARVSLIARQLGGEKELSPDQVEKLMEIRKKFNIPGRHPGYKGCLPEKNTCKSKNEDGTDMEKDINKSEMIEIITKVTKRLLDQYKVN